MRPAAHALAALLLAGVAAACGEDVDFAVPSDAAADGAGSAAKDGAALDGALESSATDAAPCAPGSDAGPAGCKSSGQSCREPGDCCSERCQDDYCLPSGTCSAPGAPCEDRSSCCSERCEPDARGGLSCGTFCADDGADCNDAHDCCSLACNGGQCGGAICAVINANCTEDSGCCSDWCDNDGRCAMPPEACLPSGEACGSDSGMYCCSGVCDLPTGRCDLGPGTCRETSSPCTTNHDCCGGTCSFDAQGISVCSGCLAEGQGCNSNGDCCTGICGGLPSTCRACPSMGGPAP